MAASNEKDVKQSELKEKQRILGENKQLDQLYTHLVASKLISAQEFWTDYYQSSGTVEDKAGISGAFLTNIVQQEGTNGIKLNLNTEIIQASGTVEDKAGISGAFLTNIVQQEGTNGIKLNLNTEIIQAVFNTYPAVEKKHLELVPHEMTEAQFWTKFFQSHYFHREREVLPNPNDPFADCVKMDDAEMEKIQGDGINRKRFDLDHLNDNSMKDLARLDNQKAPQKSTLVRRCNYLSEKILAVLKPPAPAGESSKGAPKQSGFGVLNVSFLLPQWCSFCFLCLWLFCL
ncbi:unnamed protein product [Cylicostephanus goldi]|uniref:BSD domain-containing protein n=1 Tax=Cylicostephanus goldi TaxID=71465 RepID=A0A3P7R0J8_CYLGO|nr:unnamed protein product [Cylicostephanus goldi]